MAHSHHEDDKLSVHDVVDDPVIPDAQPITVFVAGELLNIGIHTARIVSERC
jgi:hypothetical protein